MEKNTLSITAQLEEYTVGLTGHLQIHGFSGFGEAWFNLTDVKAFSARLLSVALNMEGSAELLGTQSKADGSEYLERFCLRCYVLSESKVNGVIGIHVTLSEYPYSDCREEEILKVSGELQVRNQHLVDFSSNLDDLISGNINRACLIGDLNHI